MFTMSVHVYNFIKIYDNMKNWYKTTKEISKKPGMSSNKTETYGKPVFENERP
jgi:hypothetical protein